MNQGPIDMKQASEGLGGRVASPQEALQSDIRRLAKGAGTALLGRIGGRGLQLISQVVLARLLGPTDFGLFALGWTVLQMSSLIAPLGLHQGVVRYGALFWRKDNGRFRSVLLQSLGVTALLATAMALALFVAAPWLAIAVFQKPGLEAVFRGFALGVALAATLRVAAAATRITQRMQFSVLAEDVMPPALLLVIASVLVGPASWGLTGAVLAAVAGFAAGTGLASLFVWRLYGREFRAVSAASFSVRELVAFSLPASLAGIFTMLTLRVDRLLVGYFLPASDVGIYQAASQAAMLSAMILAAFNAIFSPMIARLYHEGQLERLNELFKVSTKWGLYVSLPLFLVLIVAPREVMTVVFGEPYAAGAFPMLIMAGAQLFNAATGAVGLMLIMSGHPKRWLALSVMSLLLNIALCLALIPRLGIVGAALAVAFSVMSLFGGGLLEVRRLLGLWPYDRRYLKGFMAALGTLALLFILRTLLEVEQNILGLSLLAASGMAGFAGLLLLLGIDGEDRDLLHMMRG